MGQEGALHYEGHLKEALDRVVRTIEQGVQLAAMVSAPTSAEYKRRQVITLWALYRLQENIHASIRAADITRDFSQDFTTYCLPVLRRIQQTAKETTEEDTGDAPTTES